MVPGPKRILVVEDNPADVSIIKAAFRQLNFNIEVHFLPDGQIALDYLAGKRPYGDRASYPLPHLILLDLSLPRVSGFEILQWVRAEPDLRFIPVIILSTSDFREDIQRAYTFGANSFITKPSRFNKLVQDLKLALEHWLSPASNLSNPKGSEPPGQPGTSMPPSGE